MKKIIFSLTILMLTALTAKAQDPAFDDFERSGGLGTNWTIYFGSPDVTIVYDSDLGLIGGFFGIAAWTGSIFSADQYSEAIISPDKIDSLWAQVFARRRTGDLARYAFHWSDNDGNTSGRWDIKYDGVPTAQTRILDSLVAPQPLPGDTIRIEVTTNTITGYPEIKGYHNDNLVLFAIDSATTKIMNGEPGMAFRFRTGFPQTYPQKVFEEWGGGSLGNPCATVICNNTITTSITKASATNVCLGEIEVNFTSTFTENPVVKLYDANDLLLSEVSLTNGTLNYTFTGLISGKYTVKVYDGECCEVTEDVKVKCPKPSAGFATTNITSTSAEVNWTTVSCAASYKIQYRVHGTGIWTTKNTSTNEGFKSLTGLTPSATYEWRVAAKCLNSNPVVISAYSAIQTFATAAMRSGEVIVSGFSEPEPFEMNIRPNPASDILNLNFACDNTTAQLKIINTIGQIVFAKQLYSENGNYEEQLDVSALSNGIYVLMIQTENNVDQKRLVKE